MGYDSRERFVRLLEGGDVVLSPSTGEPIEIAPNGPWVEAFPDNIRLKHASEGISQISRMTGRDPAGINFVDFMRPRSHLIKLPTHYGEGTTVRSGNRSLQIKDVAAPTDRDFESPVFRIGGGRSFRMSMRYAISGTNQAVIFTSVSLYDKDYGLVESFTIDDSASVIAAVDGTSGAWRESDVVFTTNDNACFGVVRVNYSGTTARGEAFIDEILIEPNAEGFYAYKGVADTTRHTAGSTLAVLFDTESYDHGAQFDTSTGTFTCKRPGTYLFSATIFATNFADQKALGLTLQQNGNNRARSFSYASGTSSPGCSVSIALNCARGDTVAALFFNGDTATRTVPADTGISFTGARL